MDSMDAEKVLYFKYKTKVGISAKALRYAERHAVVQITNALQELKAIPVSPMLFFDFYEGLYETTYVEHNIMITVRLLTDE